MLIPSQLVLLNIGQQGSYSAPLSLAHLQCTFLYLVKQERIEEPRLFSTRATLEVGISIMKKKGSLTHAPCWKKF